MAATGSNSGFQRALARFRGHLSPAEQEEFSITSLADVQETIAHIQEVQGSERKMRNLTRIKAFLEAMEQYGKIVEVFLNASDFLAFVWGPIKFLLQIASTWAESFDVLLDAYEEISENLPQLLEYSELFKRHAHMRKVLELMYGDILEFHRRALKFFSRPSWKQLFRSSWKTFRTQFQHILSSLSRHKHLVESQASLAEYEQSKAARVAAQNSFKDIAEAERLRRFLAVSEKIHPPNTLADHEGAVETRQESPASGRWILQDSSMRNWRDFAYPDVPALWINGIPGAGKTIVASLIIEEMRKIDSVDVGFFYCKYSDDRKNSFVDVLRGILIQLVQKNEELLSHVYEACCSSSEVMLNSLALLKQLVEVSLRSCANACIIIDGIDECEETEEKKVVGWFLAMFEKITKDDAGTLRLLFISQRDKVTEKLLAQAVVIQLDSKYHQEDIQSYARYWSMKIQQKFGISEESASQIGTDVAAQAQGLFLFAKLVLTHLYSQTTREKLFRELQPDSFPSGLEAAYERIAFRIFDNPNRSESEDAHNIFRWIICAKRPLKWNDIQSIFAIDHCLQRVDFEDRQLRVTCRDLCGSLVETGAGDTLELVHRSAKLYLLKTRRISFRSEDLQIATFCLDYLNFGCFDAKLTDPEILQFYRQGYYSFEDYAVAHWLDHVESSTCQVLPLGATSLDRLKNGLELFFIRHGSESPPAVSVSADQGFQVIRECSFTKRLDHLAHLAHQRHSNEQYLDLETQLQRRRLIYEVVTNTSPFDEASQNSLLPDRCGWFKCPKIWCQFFSDGFQQKERRDKHVSQHERQFRCSFEECLYTQLGFETEKELKRHEKNHSTSQYSEWAFPTLKPKKKLDIFAASRKGDLATIRRLVGEGANLKKTMNGKRLVDLLYLAVRHNHLDVVNYLIKQGGHDPNSFIHSVRNAVRFSGTAIVAKLLDLEPGPSYRMTFALEGLREAAAIGRADVVPLLVAHHVDVDHKFGRTGTALQIARKKGHDEFVQVLLDNGAQYTSPEPIPATTVAPQAVLQAVSHMNPYYDSDFERYMQVNTDDENNFNFFPSDSGDGKETAESHDVPQDVLPSDVNTGDTSETFDLEQFVEWNTNDEFDINPEFLQP